MAQRPRRDKSLTDDTLVALPQRRSCAPFTSNVLSVGDASGPLTDNLPASYRLLDPRTSDIDLFPTVTPTPEFLAQDLDTPRLHAMIHLLWFAGRPVPPRPLHQQLGALGREIVLHEQMETHLVWGSSRIFLKPIPRYLLRPDFWQDYLTCDSCSPELSPASKGGAEESCPHPHLRACSLGFLLSYVALLSYESDFDLAKEKRLVPSELTWVAWRRFVREILAPGTGTEAKGANALYADPSLVAPRFIYGELRLNRLNLLLVALRGPLALSSVSRRFGGIPLFQSYGSFFRSNSEWIITATAYVIVVLSAMQVGLATDRLISSQTFHDVSFGFAVFSIIMPLFAVLVVVLISCVLWAYNVMRTRRFEKRRAGILGRRWRD
ncbi:hypothetical protein V8F20_007875 [Naviculisporaceae sp. PSN 640]